MQRIAMAAMGTTRRLECAHGNRKADAGIGARDFRSTAGAYVFCATTVTGLFSDLLVASRDALRWLISCPSIE